MCTFGKISFLIRVIFSILPFFPVQDEQDEFPVFEQATYQSTVKENSESEFVTKVTAIDKDEVASVTYEIISGDRNLFEIDPKSGEIRTQKGLDYEIQRMHFLTISTEESRGIFNGKQTTCIGKKLCLKNRTGLQCKLLISRKYEIISLQLAVFEMFLIIC